MLRQYLPKDTEQSIFFQAELNAITARLNKDPKALSYAIPDAVFAELVTQAANTAASASGDGVRYET
jgi:IS30 family transposase